jgi:hypothetical protein
MSAEPQGWVPLFPLRAVLFPGAALPLHVFEPRYRAMTRRCLEESIPFSVILAREGGLAPVGCEGLIEKVLHRYPDGRLDLLVRGGRRLALSGVREHADGYLEGRTVDLADLPEAEDLALRGYLIELSSEYRRLAEDEGAVSAEEIGSAQAGAASPEGDAGSGLAGPRSPGGAGYTFLLAAESGLGLEEKQQLLESVSEREREQLLLRHLSKEVPALRGRVARIATVRGNGRMSGSG